MKKILSIFLVALIALSCFGITASAAGDSFSAATNINIGTRYSSSITSSSTKDFFKFSLSNSGRIKLSLSAEIKYAYFYIYASNDTENPVWKTGGIEWNSTTELISLNRNIDLTSGTYYFVVKQGNSHTGSYNFKLSFTSASESFKETQGGNNNKTSTADSISLGTKYYGQIAANDTRDFYKFTVSSSNTVNISVSASIIYSYYYIYDSSANQVWGSGGKEWNSSTELFSLSKSLTLSAGTYYFCVEQGLSHTGNYNFKITSSSSGSGGSSSSSSVDLSVSKSSVNIAKGDTATVTCSYTGSNSNGITISYSRGDKEIVSCEWGSWSKKKIPVTIKGLKEGSTTITVKLKDSKTDKLLDSEVINVTVGSGDSGSSGGSGSSGSGSTGFFLFDLFYIIVAIIASFFLI